MNIDNIDKLYAENLKRLRKERGLTQTELAKLAGTYPQYVSNIEKGEKNLGKDMLERFSAVLGVGKEEFLRQGAEDFSIDVLYVQNRIASTLGKIKSPAKREALAAKLLDDLRDYGDK